jgi:hypothetical protein
MTVPRTYLKCQGYLGGYYWYVKTFMLLNFMLSVEYFFSGHFKWKDCCEGFGCLPSYFVSHFLGNIEGWWYVYVQCDSMYNCATYLACRTYVQCDGMYNCATYLACRTYVQCDGMYNCATYLACPTYSVVVCITYLTSLHTYVQCDGMYNIPSCPTYVRTVWWYV